MRSVEHDARRERVGLKDTVQAGSAWAGRDPRDWSRGIFDIMVLYTSQEVRDLLLIRFRRYRLLQVRDDVELLGRLFFFFVITNERT